MEQNVKEILLKRSDKHGFGFSIIGGVGSELPPVICDIVEHSPADQCDEVNNISCIVCATVTDTIILTLNLLKLTEQW